MTGIVEFLLARVADDEADANTEDADYAHTMLLPTYDSDHQVRWDTGRVRDECKAKRLLIDYIQGVEMQIDGEWGIHGDYRDEQGNAIRFGPDLMPGLHVLASVYSDHPDFDPAWKVTE